jgi:AraC family transcriptional regulator
MEPVIIEKPEIKLVGMSFYGDPFDTHSGWDGENEIGRVWTRFMQYWSGHGATIPNIANHEAMYEVHVYTEETITKGLFEVFVGLEVAELVAIPIDLVAKTLPPTEYAAFTFKGATISSDWQMEIDEWITAVGYQRAHSFSFQYYDHRFKGVDNLADSVLDVYMPVKPLTLAP